MEAGRQAPPAGEGVTPGEAEGLEKASRVGAGTGGVDALPVWRGGHSAFRGEPGKAAGPRAARTRSRDGSGGTGVQREAGATWQAGRSPRGRG